MHATHIAAAVEKRIGVRFRNVPFMQRAFEQHGEEPIILYHINQLVSLTDMRFYLYANI